MLPSFLFTTCQTGAERALKEEISRLWPDFRAAFSRPGFVTFKLPPDHNLPANFDPGAVFARSHGFSLGKVTGQTEAVCAATAIEMGAAVEFDEVHVSVRGELENELVPAATGALAKSQGLQALGFDEAAVAARVSAFEGESLSDSTILDCVLVDPHEWWIGYHRTTSTTTRWPGGWFLRPLPEHAVSRAYLKMEEALAWSEMPMSAGEHVAEIGCAPGGASQALLDRGLVVLGIDPAEIDPCVIANPHFTHIRKRGHEVKRREFRKTRWLTADMNVAPQYTLDTVDAIVTHPEIDVRGMLLTLKMLEWTLADEIPAYLERIRSWGYHNVRARQLSHNRREICVAARRR